MSLVNEKIVLENYLNQISKNNIIFLKNNPDLKNKIEKQILKLKNEENMHNKVQIAKDLWKSLFEASMSFIDPDKRGYDKLFQYFDEYVDFEELIFASDSFYRDHTLHCLWVYFLGEYLIDKYNLDLNNEFNIKSLGKLVDILESLNNNDIFNDLINKTIKISELDSYSDSVRCISALTHDLGYPLKKISKINQCIKRILPYFGVSNYDEFNFNYNEVQQNYIRNFLDILNSPIGFSSKDIEDIDSIELLNKLFSTNNIDEACFFNIDRGAFNNLSKREKLMLKQILTLNPKISKSTDKALRTCNDFEQYQHGIMSAFLLMKTVKSFENMSITYYNANTISDLENEFPDYMSKWFILDSITNHTSESYQINSINTKCNYLIFIDEIEEFSRISRANQNRQYVNEFCTTEITNLDDCFQIDFIFNNSQITNLDPERAFKDKCKRFLTVFNVPNLNKDLKIIVNFIGKLPYDNNVYKLEIARKYANITINDIEQNIPSYLKSTQFYTKEGYMNL